METAKEFPGFARGIQGSEKGWFPRLKKRSHWRLCVLAFFVYARRRDGLDEVSYG